MPLITTCVAVISKIERISPIAPLEIKAFAHRLNGSRRKFSAIERIKLFSSITVFIVRQPAIVEALVFHIGYEGLI